MRHDIDEKQKSCRPALPRNHIYRNRGIAASAGYGFQAFAFLGKDFSAVNISHALRQSGIQVVGTVPWGTHFCELFRTGADLLETVVPYIQAGLAANEFCMWITAEPLHVEEAKTALRAATPDLDEHMTRGQIEVLDYNQWFRKSGAFDAGVALDGWDEKLGAAIKRGYEGLRLCVNTSQLGNADWGSVTDYAEAFATVVGRHKMIALSTYSLDNCDASRIIDVVNNHEFAIVKRQDRWEMLQSARMRKTHDTLKLRADIPAGRPNIPARALALFVAAAGIAVTAGWIFDVSVLKSLAPGWVSMKFSTAIAFVLSGATLFYLAVARERGAERAQVALSILSLTLALLMGLLFFSAVFGVPTGIENIFIRDTGDRQSVVPGRPSLPTMVCFLLVALSAIIALFNPARLLPILRIIGLTIGATGATAAIGYTVNVPLLYYYIGGANSAMALHTALLFVLLGTGLICL
jgi:hypothetical protein